MDNTNPELPTQESSTSPTPSPYTTAIAFITNIALIFLAMVTSGVSFTHPTPLDVYRRGCDFGPATIGAHQ